MKLSQRAIQNLQATERDLLIWDQLLPGFGVRVKPSGHKSYVIQYRCGALSRRLTIGSCATFKLEEARKRARRLLVEAKDGGDPAIARLERRSAPMVVDLAERYMAVHAATKKKPRSQQSDATNLRLHIVPTLGRKQVAEITRDDISRLHHSMRDTPGAANRVLALLSKMFNLAEKWGLRPDGSNPCRHIERYPERKMERFLSSEELQQLGAALTNAEREGVEMASVIAAIRLLVFTGARLGEILNLRWDDMDLERSCLRLSDSKTGRKNIYLSAPALEVLSRLERQDRSPWVLAGAVPNRPLVNLRKPWHRIRVRAGLEDVRLHDLRHSFASIGVAGGLSLPMIGALLGHTQPTTTARYAHLASDPLKQAADLIGQRIVAAMQAAPASDVIEFKSGHRSA